MMMPIIKCHPGIYCLLANLRALEAVDTRDPGNYKRPLLISLLILFLLYLAPPSQAEVSQKLTDLLAQTNTMSANFHQSVQDSSGGILQKTSGTITLKKPGQFRCQTTDPFEQLIIANDEKLWIYDVDLEQATLYPIEKTLSQTPALLLSGGISNLDEHFTITAINHEYQLIPKKIKETGFEWIKIRFRQGIIDKIHMQDMLGQHTHIFFDKVLTNKPVQDRLFDFLPPEGIDIIRY